jgi:hypothetical protein
VLYRRHTPAALDERETGHVDRRCERHDRFGICRVRSEHRESEDLHGESDNSSSNVEPNIFRFPFSLSLPLPSSPHQPCPNRPPPLGWQTSSSATDKLYSSVSAPQSLPEEPDTISTRPRDPVPPPPPGQRTATPKRTARNQRRRKARRAQSPLRQGAERSSSNSQQSPLMQTKRRTVCLSALVCVSFSLITLHRHSQAQHRRNRGPRATGKRTIGIHLHAQLD